jgi:hypothetical protein
MFDTKDWLTSSVQIFVTRYEVVTKFVTKITKVAVLLDFQVLLLRRFCPNFKELLPFDPHFQRIVGHASFISFDPYFQELLAFPFRRFPMLTGQTADDISAK